jgi:hypothetical protein
VLVTEAPLVGAAEPAKTTAASHSVSVPPADQFKVAELADAGAALKELGNGQDGMASTETSSK